MTVSLVSNKMRRGGAGKRKENDQAIKQKVSYQTNVVIEAVTEEVQGQPFAPSFTL